MILLSRLLSSTTRISSKISTSFDVNLIMNWTFMSSILLSNSSIPFSMSTCSTLEVYYLKVTRKYLPYSDGSFASSVFESFISFFKALYFLNSWPSCKFFKNVWTVFFWMENCIYSDMENKTICGPAFHVCAPYRCKYKSIRDICI